MGLVSGMWDSSKVLSKNINVFRIKCRIDWVQPGNTWRTSCVAGGPTAVGQSVDLPTHVSEQGVRGMQTRQREPFPLLVCVTGPLGHWPTITGPLTHNHWATDPLGLSYLAFLRWQWLKRWIFVVVVYWFILSLLFLVSVIPVQCQKVECNKEKKNNNIKFFSFFLSSLLFSTNFETHLLPLPFFTWRLLAWNHALPFRFLKYF